MKRSNAESSTPGTIENIHMSICSPTPAIAHNPIFTRFMGRSLAVTTIMSAFLLIAVLVGGADAAPQLPAYPNQPKINAALNQLTLAQQKIDSNPADTITHLQKAGIALEASKNDKGSFRRTSIRLTNQAAKHLEKNDTETARHEIEEAIENVKRAGEAGAD
jgi:hypothetical protein